LPNEPRFTIGLIIDDDAVTGQPGHRIYLVFQGLFGARKVPDWPVPPRPARGRDSGGARFPRWSELRDLGPAAR